MRPAGTGGAGSPPRLIGAAPTYVKRHSYGEFIFSRSFLQSSDKLPATVGLVVQFFGTFTKDISGAMAFGAIYLTPILAIFVVVQRHLISGLTAGAVK